MGQQGQIFDEEPKPERKGFRTRRFRDRLAKEDIELGVGSVSAGSSVPDPQPGPKKADPTRESVLLEIEELAKAVNEGSKHVAGYYSAFLLVTVYVIVSVASTTHMMILLESSLPLPLLGVGLPLKSFYFVVPIVYILLHLNLVLHSRMLESQANELDACLGQLKPEWGETKNDLRLLKERHRKMLFPFFINRSLLIPEQDSWMRKLCGILFWWILFGIPILVLLFIQFQFLPYHSGWFTFWHRFVLMADIGILAAGWGWADDPRAIRPLPNRGVWITPFLGFVAIYVSFFLFTIPDEKLDRTWISLSYWEKPVPWETDPTTGEWLPDDFRHRSLDIQNEVIGKDLPPVKDRLALTASDYDRDRWLESLPTLDLSNRDFSYANFSGSKFYKVRFSHNRLVQANFTYCLFENLKLSASQIEGSVFYGTHGHQMSFSGVTATNTDFRQAEAIGSSFTNVDFADSFFDNAQMQASMWTSCNFTGGKLDWLNVNGSNISNCSFSASSLQSSIFSHSALNGCEFMGADLSKSEFEYCVVNAAKIRGSNFANAFFNLSSLEQIDLQSTDPRDDLKKLHGARIRAAIEENEKAHVSAPVAINWTGEIYGDPKSLELMKPTKPMTKRDEFFAKRHEHLKKWSTFGPFNAEAVWRNYLPSDEVLHQALIRAYEKNEIQFPYDHLPQELFYTVQEKPTK